MSAAFTPGPWAVDPLGIECMGDISTADGSQCVAQAQQVVCDTRRQDTRRANARLIAAAPDLLAALLEILGPLNVCSDNQNVRDDECLPVDMTMGELRKARAAIARALGTPASEGEE